MTGKTIAQWIVEHRKALKMRQKEFIEATGLSQAYVSALENGRYRPSFECWCAVAKILEPEATDQDLVKLFRNSNPENRAMSEEEESLLRSFRKGDVAACYRIIDRRAMNAA